MTTSAGNAQGRAWVHAWLMLLPALVLLVAFTHWPTLATFIDSFHSTPRGSRPSQPGGKRYCAGAG